MNKSEYRLKPTLFGNLVLQKKVCFRQGQYGDEIICKWVNVKFDDLPSNVEIITGI